MAKKKTSIWSRLNGWLHLWLGLTSGIIVFIVALTGTMFIFCDDIIDAIAGKKGLYVKEAKEKRHTPEELLASFKKAHPDRKAFYFVQYKDPKRTFKIGSAGKDDRFTFTWVDPYTGEMLASSGAYYFFYVVAHVHSGEIPFGHTGNLIVQIATWIFLAELITGLILWWPKKWTRTTRQQSFAIKWKAGFKRVNYDLHNVPGFYSLLPALLLTVTGLIIVNDTMKQATRKVFGGGKGGYADIRKASPPYDSAMRLQPLSPVTDSLLALPGVNEVRLTIPAKDSITAYLALAARELGLKGMRDGQIALINRYTNRPVPLPEDLKKAIAIDDMNMNLHIGFWWGWWGKTITAVVGIICMSLPITGFLIWLGRKKKKKKPLARVRYAGSKVPA